MQVLNVSSSRTRKTARRIVRMFQFYQENINPEDEVFLEYVSNYLKQDANNPDSLPYHELYAKMRSAIREFIKTRGEEQARQNKK